MYNWTAGFHKFIFFTSFFYKLHGLHHRQFKIPGIALACNWTRILRVYLQFLPKIPRLKVFMSFIIVNFSSENKTSSNNCTVKVSEIRFNIDALSAFSVVYLLYRAIHFYVSSFTRNLVYALDLSTFNKYK